MTFGGARMHAVFTIYHATIDYGAFNRTNFNTAIDHLTRLLIIRGKNPLYGSSSFSHDHLIRALNHCYQVGPQYLKHHTQKRPKILKLCLRVS